MGIELIAIAAVVASGTGLYMAMKGPPNIPPPPAPANAYQYNDDGSVTVQRWDEEKNAYITERDPEPEAGTSDWDAWKVREDKKAAETELRGRIEKQNLEFLDAPPAERVAMYETYQKTFSDAMHKEVDQLYADRYQELLTDLEVKGQTGSTIHKDVLRDLNEIKQSADIDIVQQSIFARESLEQADKQSALTVLDYLDRGSSTEQAERVGEFNLAQRNAEAGTAATAGRYAAQISPALLNWQNQQKTGRTLLDTAGGLAYLYGFKNPGGGGTLSPGGGGGKTAGNYLLNVRGGKYNLATTR